LTGVPTAASASTITVADTLELLEGRFAAVASGVANGAYVLWLGSGISRDRLPDLRELILKVLNFLHSRSAPAGMDCPFRDALARAVDMARLRPPELAQVDLDDPPTTWPVIDLVLEGLWDRYSELLDILVGAEDPDFLLWEAVDVRATYGRGIEPDCEHLCIGILVLEGALREATTANWDGLIEAAIELLAGDADAVIRVVVLPDELREPERDLTLLKFHGCAVLAARDPAKYRAALVGMRSQITSWNTSGDTRPIREHMVSLATTKRTLMIGLSAQDENIQRVFAEARESMNWPWPVDPPAQVFGADRLGDDHLNLLRVVYGNDYAPNKDAIDEGALIRAYGKPLLTALVLFVLTAKLRAYLEEADAPLLPGAEREQLGEGLTELCHRLATVAEPDRLRFVERLAAEQRRGLALFQEGKEPAPDSPAYKPFGNLPPDRVHADPALSTNGVRELAAALALLGRGLASGRWSAGSGRVPSGAEGALMITSGGSDSAVFFAANARAAVRLESEGLVDRDAEDVVLVHSTGPVTSMARSPRGGYGRTGHGGVREVDMSDLLRTTSSVLDLEEGFRQAAAL
jgi:hypothetical protein